MATATRRSLLTSAAAVGVAAAVGACTPNNRSTPKTNPTDKVIVRTSFGSYGREGYPVVAAAKGYFAEEGIQASYLFGDGQPTDVTQLSQGRYQFLAWEFTQYAEQMASGIAKNTKMINAVHQHTVLALMGSKKSGINTPADLQGKRIGYSGPAVPDLFPAYASVEKFSPGNFQVNGDGVVTPDRRYWTFYQPNLLFGQFAAGRVDAIAQFVPGLPSVEAVAQKSGRAGVTLLPYADVLTDLYGNITVTTDKLIEENRDLVERFNRALLRGLQYAVENPDEAGRLINKKWSQTAAPSATAELSIMKGYTVAGGTQVGALDQSRVMRGIALLVSTGKLKEGALAGPTDLANFDFPPPATQ